MNFAVVPWMYTIKLLLHRMKMIPTLVREKPSLSPPCSSAQVKFDRPLSVCRRHSVSFWAKHLFGASLKCFKATLGFQLSWRCQCWINWSSPKSDCIYVTCKTNRELLQYLAAKQADGVPDYIPSARLQDGEGRDVSRTVLRCQRLAAGGCLR